MERAEALSLRRRESGVSVLPFDRLERDLPSIVDRMLKRNETIVVERKGARFAMRPVGRGAAGGARRTRSRGRSDADYRAFLSSAGAWSGAVDAEDFSARLRQSRAIPPHPPVRL